MTARARQVPMPADELWAYIQANVAYVGSHRERVKGLVANAMNFTDEDRRSRLLPLHASVYGDSLAPLLDNLQHGQEQGQFAEFDTRTRVMSIRPAIDAIGPQLNAMGVLVTERAWELPAAGTSLRERWAAIAPELARHGAAVRDDAGVDQPTLCLESPAWATTVSHCATPAPSLDGGSR
ncbi:hypothetical protein [Streptomyces sp. WZ-12]|uniref:hypothetical protein n=1 Tax=Streptomyces sp. WZ-12 TaxID=3030210 RepID=UPI0023816165|nr:hypothetical protein [Streptomyces sp. WZ-12]